MKPGSVPGPVTVKPDKKSDLVDYRRAKRLQDFLNSEFARTGCSHSRAVWSESTPGGLFLGGKRAVCVDCGADVTDGIDV